MITGCSSFPNRPPLSTFQLSIGSALKNSVLALLEEAPIGLYYILFHSCKGSGPSLGLHTSSFPLCRCLVTRKKGGMGQAPGGKDGEKQSKGGGRVERESN